MNTPVRPSRLTGTTAAIFALLGLIDLGLLGVIGSADAPPLIVSFGVATLGLITLIALVPAYRGSRSALLTIVVVRVISALLAIPAFFLGAPTWVMIVEGFVIVATIAALILLRSPALPKPEAA
jgi:hypothetical protein